MVTVKLIDEKNTEMKHAAHVGNETVLIQDDESRFPMLAQLSDCSNDVFTRDDMVQVVSELQALEFSTGDPEMKKHIRDVISIAEKCRDTPGTTLCFSPFER